MHAFFELGTLVQSDSTVQALSWMGKVPDDIPEASGWRLNRATYYQEGWLATGNSRGLVGVTFTASHCMYDNRGKESGPESALPQRTNFNLRGHRAQVIFVCWNEPYQKLASVDSAGVIFVWVRYESRWSIELINDRGIPVRHFSWSHDGRLALIAYQDGFVLVGSVAGQRFWSASVGNESTILCGTWSPDDQQVYLGMSSGSITVLDIHGNLMAQVRISTGSTYYVSTTTVNSLAWNCAKFKMDDADETASESSNKCANKTNILAALCNKSCLYFMTSYDDPSPVVVCTGLNSCHMEWSNSGEYLAVGGTSRRDGQGNFLNMVKFYTAVGSVRYVVNLSLQQNPITSLTWGHNDRRLFVATGVYLHIGWVSRKPPGLSHLSRIVIRNQLASLPLVAGLPLPVKLKAQVSCLFSRTVYNAMGFESSIRTFATQPPLNNTRLFCTMIRLEDGSTESQSDPEGEFGNVATYVLYVEFLGGLVPLLKGKRTSKLRPEFVIFDPECNQLQKSEQLIEESLSPKMCPSPRRGVFKSPGSPLLARFSPRLARRQNNSQRRPTGHVDPLAHIEMLVQAGLLNPPSPEEVTRDRNRDQNEIRRVRVGGFNPDEMERRGRTSEASEEVNEWSHSDTLPEHSKLAEVTSNIWGTRFRLTGIGEGLPEDLGQITYRTSLLHLQPRQMTLLVTVLDGATVLMDSEPLKPPDLKADPEENYENPEYGVVQEIPIAPMTPRLPRNNQSDDANRRSVLLENTDNSDEDETHHLLPDTDTGTSTDTYTWNFNTPQVDPDKPNSTSNFLGPIRSYSPGRKSGTLREVPFSSLTDNEVFPSILQLDPKDKKKSKSQTNPGNCLDDLIPGGVVSSIDSCGGTVPTSPCAKSPERRSSTSKLFSLVTEKLSFDVEEVLKIKLSDGVPYKMVVSRPRSFSTSHIDFVKISVESWANTRGQKHLSPRKLMRLLLKKRRSKPNFFARKSRSLDSSPVINFDPNFQCSLLKVPSVEKNEEVTKDLCESMLTQALPVSEYVPPTPLTLAKPRPPRIPVRGVLESESSFEEESLLCLRFVRPKLSAFEPGKLSPFTARRWLHKPPREENLEPPSENISRGKSAPATPNSSPRPVRRRQAVRRENCSPIRQIFSSPLMPRRWRSAVETSIDDSTDSSSSEDESKIRQTRDFTNLEAFQRQQLRNKMKRHGGLEARRDKNRPRQVVLQNKAPFWNEHSQVYQLDFGGRVTQESAKNFQIEYQGKQVMQFGRIDARAYTLDFQYPFSPAQAFGVALANVTQRLK